MRIDIQAWHQYLSMASTFKPLYVGINNICMTSRFFGLILQHGLSHMSVLRPMMDTLAKLLIASSAPSVLPQQMSKRQWLIVSGHARKW